MIAYCGLKCSECSAYLATQNDSDEEREKVAKMWGKLFKTEFKKEDVSCDGCHENSQLSVHCKVCPVRLCGKEKEVETCAHCDDYMCETLDGLLNMIGVTPARQNLEKIRETL